MHVCFRGVLNMDSAASNVRPTLPHLVLCVIVLTLSFLQPSLSDSSWDYADVKSKAEAVLRATGAAPSLRKPPGAAIGPAAMTQHAVPTAFHSGQGACGEAMFSHWAKTFNYTFTRSARTAARTRFCINMERVKEINSDPSISFWASGNAFTHMSFDEFSSHYLSDLTADEPPASAPHKPAPARSSKLRKLLSRPAPPPTPYVGWVQAGKVTAIRQQGASCNACWAFAVVSAIESMYLISANGSAGPSADDPAMHLSEQQLVSCVSAAAGYRSRGCTSGRSDEALDYAADNALVLNSLYPYAAAAPACNPNRTAAAAPGQYVRLSGYHRRVPANDESAMMQAVQTAPTIAYFSVDSSFVLYAGGVYTPLDSTNNTLNHALVLVGYNATDAGAGGAGRHWLARNHWGGFWGEKGYARVAMTGDAAGGAGPCGMYQVGFLPPAAFASPPLQLPGVTRSAASASPAAAKQA